MRGPVLAVLPVRDRYLLFAADPYETIAFKIPNLEIDKEKFTTDWDKEALTFKVRLHFKQHRSAPALAPSGPRQRVSYHGATV